MNFWKRLFSNSEPPISAAKRERMIFYLTFKSTDLTLCQRIWEQVERQIDREIPNGIIEIFSAQVVEKDQVVCVQMDVRDDRADQMQDAVVRLWRQYGGSVASK